MTRRRLLPLITLLVLAAPAAGQGAAPPPDPAATMAAALRGLLLQALPEPLYEDTRHWGGQKSVVRGVKWRGKGLNARLEPQYSPKNDGLWWKVRVTADRPAETLYVEVRDLQRPESGRTTFTAVVALDTRIDYDRQRWQEGTRLWSAGVRARVRLVAALQCEVVSRVENSAGLLPEVTFRLRVLGSRCGYEGLKVEHVAGLGGEAAELLGKAFVAALHQWRPSLERNLIARAEAAIVKAGDTHEVRVGLLGMLRK